MEWFYLLVLSISFLLTGVMRVYSFKYNVIDVPNSRSSHVAPVPRGGGGAIVLSTMISILWLWGNEGSERLLWLMVASGLVALIGFYDDHRHVSPLYRILCHFIASVVIVVGVVGGLPSSALFGVGFYLGTVIDVLAVIALVWLLNLYNFMDGIDGIAGVEAVTTGTVMALLLALASADEWLVHMHWLVVVSVAGFLIWNFPPAKIFMGDVGSGFLGLMIGALLLLSSYQAPKLFWAWLIMLGVFIVDATLTLSRRLLRGDKVYEAHRSHAYQYASRYFSSHLFVTTGVAIINLLWLAPIAYLVTIEKLDAIFGLIVAYLPLLAIALKFNAGKLETRNLKY